MLKKKNSKKEKCKIRPYFLHMPYVQYKTLVSILCLLENSSTIPIVGGCIERIHVIKGLKKQRKYIKNNTVDLLT